MKRALVVGLVAGALVSSSAARAETFQQGALIIPMDTTYQDNGMLKAFGLVYELLRNDVPVQWVIRPGKAHLGVDFTASGVDHKTRAAITAYGYRGGPWVIRSTDAAKAIPIINAWQTANPAVAVHEVTAPFWGDVARSLIVAPTIAMHQDGNEKIARGYLQAAGIPDSTLDPTWPTTSPDMLTPAEVAGPTTTSHHDGKLFDADGDPVYCQFMSMHWNVTEAAASPETVVEVREYLKHPVHFFAECQAVNAFEGAPPVGGRGNFLTTQGFIWPAPGGPNTYDFYNDDSPFAQIDGVFKSVGGSEPAYSLPVGGAYKARGITMITEAGTPEGDTDVWMTGFLDGVCPPAEESCGNSYGKVSYLGGHQYSTSLPISKNPQTQGTRLFLNSLFEAPCATQDGQPGVDLTKSAPDTTVTGTVTFDLDYENFGPGVALSAVISDQLPAGATFVSATAGYVLVGNTVKWNVGNLGAYESGRVSVTVLLSGFGTYANTAHIVYKVGLNNFGFDSNTTGTIYDKDTDGDGIVDSVDICPNHYNPAQNLQTDILSCGTCGVVCAVANGAPACMNGMCAVGSCQNGFSDCDGSYANGCEHADTGVKCCDCTPAHATGSCVASACMITVCDSGFSNCDKLVANGCEYDNSLFATDPLHCGGCDTVCTFAYATALCEAGSCKMGTCNTDYADVDSKEANGCECHVLAAIDTTCDGVDDDCNGLVDDGYVPTTCGQGACASKSQCSQGAVVACTPGVASTEGPAGDSTCMDQVDNDCDGMMDDADPDCVSLDAGSETGDDTGSGTDASDAGVSSDGTPIDDAAATPDSAATTTGGGSSGAAGAGMAAGAGGASVSTGAAGSASGGAAGAMSGGSAGATSGGSGGGLAGAGGSVATGSGSGSGGAVSTGAGGSTSVGSAGSRSGSAGSNIGTAGTSATDTPANGDQGGCACRVGHGSDESKSAAPAWLVAVALAFARARRRDRRRANHS